MTRTRNTEGFTLIELLIVMFIIGILTAIAIPMFFLQRDKAKNSSVQSGAHTIEIAIATFAVDNGDTYPADVATKAVLVAPDGEPYVSEWPKNAWTGADMKDGTGLGDYTYTTLTGHFRLAGHMTTGDFVVP